MASEVELSNASLYSTTSLIQYKTGCSFVDTFDLKLGDKVLDVGCGTGEVTKYVAKQVGDLGKVIGIDPDDARVKLAQENTRTVSNASFHVGDSKLSFLNDYQGYFNLHFSNHVYTWLSDEEKAVYVEVAFRCLKPGGSIAVQCVAQPDDDIDSRVIESSVSRLTSVNFQFAEERPAKELLSNVGFTEIDVKIIPSVTYFSSFKAYAEAFLASSYTDINELPDKELLEEFKLKAIEKDGRVKSKFNLMQIRARKPQ